MNPAKQSGKQDLESKKLQAQRDALKKELKAAKKEIEALKQELEKAQPELDRLKNLAARAQADLQNAKDRIQKEGAQMRKFALEGMLMRLLPTIDNFQRAFQHIPKELESDEWTKGMQGVNQELMRSFTDLGLKKIEALGQAVDTQKHEVLQTGEGEKGTVVEVFEEGYEFQGKVLRPAKVKVGEG